MLRGRIRWCGEVPERGEVLCLVGGPCLERCWASLPAAGNDLSLRPWAVNGRIRIASNDVGHQLSRTLGKRLGSALYWGRGFPNNITVTILDAQNVAAVDLCAIVREGTVGGE